jgi:hypothetical protein
MNARGTDGRCEGGKVQMVVAVQIIQVVQMVKMLRW